MKEKVTKSNIVKPRDIVLERRKDVAEKHYIERKSIREIAKEMGHSPNTIFLDLEYLKKHFDEQITVIDKNEILRSIIYNRNFNLRRLVEIRKEQKAKENTSTELRVIEIIDELHTNTIDDMIKLSFIEKPLERQEVEVKDYKFEVIDVNKDGTKRVINRVGKKSKAKASV